MTSRVTGCALALLAGAALLASSPMPAPAQELSGRPIRLRRTSSSTSTSATTAANEAMFL